MIRLGNTTEVENPMVDDSKLWAADADYERLRKRSKCCDCAKCNVPSPLFSRNADTASGIVQAHSPWTPFEDGGKELAYRIFSELNYANTLNCWCDAAGDFVSLEDSADGCDEFEPR